MTTLNLVEAGKLITAGVAQYETSAPTVSAYLEDLYERFTRRPDDCRLSEVLALLALCEDGVWEQPNYAANRVYKLQSRLGMDTTGHVGF
jgi:hypothetical protein